MYSLLIPLVSYVSLGILFSLCFVFIIAGMLDIHARGATFGFRLLIFPATFVLWPILFFLSIVRGIAYCMRRVNIQETKKTSGGGKK